MSRANSQHDNSEATMIVCLIAAVMVMIMAAMFYKSHKGPINAVVVKCVSAQLSVLAPFSVKTAAINDNLNTTDPWDLEPADFWALASYAGRRLRWIVVPLSMALAALVYVHMGKVQKMTRTHTMRSLLENNVKNFPQLAPIVNRKRPINEEPVDSGPWRTARTSLQFALENKLIVDQDNTPVKPEEMLGPDGLACHAADSLKLKKILSLDTARAEHVFAEQLGDVFQGPDSLKPYQLALAAAFLAYGHSDRQAATDMFNQLSLSFCEQPKDTREAFTFDVSGARQLLEKYATDPRLLSQHGSYVNCWMSAALEYARQKGVIACATFIWLRPADRTLWYALNQCDRRVAWPESSGVRAHMQAEQYRANPITTPQVESAVTALWHSLADAGYIYPENDNMEE